MKRFLIPLALFVVLVVFLAIGLTRDPHEVPSPLIGKPAPAFTLPRLDAVGAVPATFSASEMQGKVWLLNVWASWCVSCRQEHPVLVEFARQGLVPLVGLDYKDDPVDGRRWLGQFGNPYTLSVVDRDGRVGIDFGVYGVPETYLIDRQGVIRFKHIGPVTPEVLSQRIVPLIRQLQG
jgi:cytochrome c biogenesis protein CcmG/thiol:disulfide interchange protein DsbE